MLFTTHLSYYHIIRRIYNNIYHALVPLPHYQTNLPYYCSLQWIQNQAARILKRRRNHITPVSRELHWLTNHEIIII